MLEPPIPDDEEKRLALLKACNIIYTPAEEAFDDVARLAADLCGTEIALITLVDSDYQWFKARVGVEQTGTARDLSFCGHCINHRHPLVVEDTHADPRFADNPLVTGDPHIRFYAGVPLLVEEARRSARSRSPTALPRTLTPRQLESLERLAQQIARELRLRRDLDRGPRERRPRRSRSGPGRLAGRWRVVRELGRGGFGRRLRGARRAGGRVAIKVLLPEWRTNEEVVERFAREARVLMRLKPARRQAARRRQPRRRAGRSAVPRARVPRGHGPRPGPRVPGARALSRRLLVVRRRLRRRRRSPRASASSTATSSRRTCSSPTGARGPVVKVLDFGIAAGRSRRRGPSKITSLGAVVGSPAYMSPEQMMAPSDVDARSDVWSMGAVLYELVTGQLPFRGDSDLQVFANVMTKPRCRSAGTPRRKRRRRSRRSPQVPAPPARRALPVDDALAQALRTFAV